MARLKEEIEHLRLLDLPPGIHDDDARRHLRDDAEIMGDEDDGGAASRLHRAHQIEDLRLNGDVERGGRFVGDQELGIAGERHGDHHALAHAARELVWILPRAAFGFGNVDEAQHLDGARRRGGTVEALMKHQRFADLARDTEHRIERGHRLLEDHGDLVAADAPHLGLARLEKIAPGEADGAADDAAGRRRHEPQDRERSDALAATALAHHRQGLASADVVGDAVHRAHDAVTGEEMRAQVRDGEERLGRAAHSRRASRGSSASRKPSPTRFTASTVSERKAPGKSTR